MSLPTPPLKRARQPQLSPKVPGWQELTFSVIQVWLSIAILGYGAGVVWRFMGTGPGVFELFDGLGYCYWVIPLLLIGGWEKMRARQTMHFSRGKGIYGLAFQNTIRMFGYFALISVAPLGLFSSLGDGNFAAHIMADIFDIYLGYPQFVFITLLFSGTAVLGLSLVSLIGCRRLLGSGPGVIAWGVLGVLLNSSAITGLETWGFYFSFSGLAEVARDALNLGLINPAQASYVTDAAKMVYVKNLGAIVLIAGLLFALQKPYFASPKRQNPYWLAGVIGVSLPAIFTWSHTSVWVSDPSIAYPWTWQTLFLTGLIPMLIVYTLSVWSQTQKQAPLVSLDGLLLLWLCPLAWVAYSLPVIQAGLVNKPQLVLACGACMVLLLLWILLIGFCNKLVQSFPPAKGILLALLLFIPAIPLDGAQHSGLAMVLINFTAAFEGTQLIIAAWVLGLVVPAIALAVWAVNRPSALTHGRSLPK